MPKPKFTPGDYALIDGEHGDVVNVAVIADADALDHLAGEHDHVVLVTGRDDRPAPGWRHNKAADKFAAPPQFAVLGDDGTTVIDVVATWDPAPTAPRYPAHELVPGGAEPIGPGLLYTGKGKFMPKPDPPAGPPTSPPARPPA